MINVAIDGPSGAGKSTVSRAVAAMLGYIYIDTGAMYRTVAYKAISLGIEPSDAKSVAAMLQNTVIDIKHCDDGQHMFVDGTDVTDKIRTPQISMGASAVAAIPEVRAWLLETQRSFAAKSNCIMDGRDIGTVVLPNAQVKIFLTASPEARARRRYDELEAKGETVDFDEVLDDMIKRDKADSSRDCAPLAAADDAVIVDSGDIDFDETVRRIAQIIINRG